MFSKGEQYAQISARVLNVSLGTLDSRQFHAVVNVSQIVLNPMPYIDLALLRLETSVLPEQGGLTIDPIYRINTICLPEIGRLNFLTEEAIVSGFGVSEIPNYEKRSHNYMLRKAIVTIDSVYECHNSRGIPDFMICSPDEEHNTCFVSNWALF